MFISPDGVVTGSVNWTDLEDRARRKDGEGVTGDGWKAVNELLKEHGRGVAEAEQEAKESAEAAEKANAEAGAGAPATVAPAAEQGEASDKGASSAPAKKAAAKRTSAKEIK